jgi:hypothetical protein
MFSLFREKIFNNKQAKRQASIKGINSLSGRKGRGN